MTIKAQRLALGLTQPQLAAALRMGRHGRRRVLGWEHGEYRPNGPTIVAIELLARLTAEEREAYLRCRPEITCA